MEKTHTMIISYRKEEYPESENNAVLSINADKRISNQDDLVEALRQNNAYVLDYLDGIIEYKGVVEDDTLQRFRIDFFDSFNSPSLISYLEDDESDYRLTRLSDDAIIRLSRADSIITSSKTTNLEGAPSYEISFEEEPKIEERPIQKKRRKIMEKLRLKNI